MEQAYRDVPATSSATQPVAMSNFDVMQHSFQLREEALHKIGSTVSLLHARMLLLPSVRHLNSRRNSAPRANSDVSITATCVTGQHVQR
jgi:hypothetical protein